MDLEGVNDTVITVFDKEAAAELTLDDLMHELLVMRSLLEKIANQISTTYDAKPTSLEKDRTSSEAVTFCLANDWIFKRAKNGQYSHAIANKAAAAFLSRHGLKDRQQLSDELNKRRSSLKGLVNVYDGVFEDLYRDFVVNGR